MAWEWTDIKKVTSGTYKDGAYQVTATNIGTDPLEVISFIAHRDRVTPAHLVEVLQKKVTELKSLKTNETDKLAAIIADADISGVK